MKMKTYAKLLTVLVIAVVFFASASAHALTISFGGQNMNAAGGNTLGDGSGLSSLYGVDATNTALPGYYIETFDGAAPGWNGVTKTYNLTKGGTVTVQNGGWFTSLNEATDLKVTGTIGIRQGTVGYAAQPGGTNLLIQDTTNFAYAPSQNGSMPVTVKVDYSADLSTGIMKGYRISYLGLYYGSIDNYNNIAFYSGDNPMTSDPLLQNTNPTYYDAPGVLSGREILVNQGGSAGNQQGVGSNVYVNIFFNPNEIFTSFELRTHGVAWEGDNIVIGLSPINVPEPASMLLLGLGLVGLAGIRRKLKK